MKRFAFIVFAVFVTGASSTVKGQSQPPAKSPTPPSTAQPSKAPDARDSVTIADVQRAADDLAIAVQQVVKKVTESPELKVAALKLATNAVNAAQVVVAQQAATLQATLEMLAREVAAVSAQQTKPKTH